jgi:FMN phosphatase YigB (HAD superfamily)
MGLIEKIGLFDLDGTLADYDSQMKTDYDRIKSQEERAYGSYPRDSEPAHVRERIRLIRNQRGWWENLPEFKLGFDILNVAVGLGFNIHALTKSPESSPNAWVEKFLWFQKHVRPKAPDAKITITQDKGLVYGTFLVDDWPEYIERWLEHRPRGIVIMPAHHWNQNFSNKQVIRYDGSDIDQVKKVLTYAKGRK